MQPDSTMEKQRIIERPNPRDAEILWEDYLNCRILYDIKDENLRVRASVGVSKSFKEITIFLEFDTDITDFKLDVSIIDGSGLKIKSETVTNRRKIEGFFVETAILSYKAISKIRNVVVVQTK